MKPTEAKKLAAMLDDVNRAIAENEARLKRARLWRPGVLLRALIHAGSLQRLTQGNPPKLY